MFTKNQLKIFLLPICNEQACPSNCKSDTLRSYVQRGIHCGNTEADLQHAVMLYVFGEDGSITSICKIKIFRCGLKKSHQI